MKTDTLKKSLLDYAIKGKLTAKFRRENSELSAFDELEIYNDKIKQKRKNLEKELKTLEFKLKKASTRHCETSAGSRGKTSEAVQGVAEAGFFSNPQTKQELKSQIQMLKKELTKCKEITPLNLSESPFTIPNSWAWVKLGDICEIVSGGTPSRDKIEYWHNGTIPWVKIADVKNNVVNQTQEFITELGLENSSAKIFTKGTLLYTIFATLGETAILNIDAATNQAIAALIEAYDYDTKFLMYCLMSMKDYVNSLGRGVAQNNINQTMLKNFTIPLPPLCEQQEIVKKLDLLVTLANDFAITKENLKRIEKRIEKSLLKLALEGSLSKLYRRSSPTLSAFNEISTYNDNIKEKRKDLEKKLKICEKELKLEKDKDKKAFFKSQIQSLKKEIVKCKEITPLNLSEAPFEIPNTWAWVKLGDICEIISGEIIDLQEENLPLLDVKYLRSKGDKKLANSGNFANANDRLILMDGENSGEIFITKEKGFLGSTLKKLEFSSLSQVEFMDFMLLCYKDFFKGNKKGAAIPHLDRKLFTNLSIPLPPLCEQEHIVQILDTLFTLKKGLRVD
ncbi:restriction endonuclease subunit S [Campylobacter upsaliensis]|uniref:restriction endonuclease subunit S n=1 Tax=Campylobacter upsaliensis TaxID=28080 RepID=UPI000E17D6AE|nr:restriction endonuclease subunit S [Campylobacter upsaliensis]SUX11910.1 Type I restriction-modification system, specificity subunit S [Campylobacter upsaliensis]